MSAAAAFGAVGVVLLFMPLDAPFVLDIPTRAGTPVLDVIALVLITTERAAGVTMVWLATLLGSALLGLKTTAQIARPPSGVVVYCAAVVAVVGLVMVFVIDATPTFTIGSFSSGPEDDAGRGMPFLLFLTPLRAVGFALVWIATLLAGFTTGHNRAKARARVQAAA